MEEDRRRVLVAMGPIGREILSAILSGCRIDYVGTFGEGEKALAEKDYAYVVIGSLFADSHMFEFAERARHMRPKARIVCVKAAGRPLDAQSRRAISTACEALGCEGLLDLTAGEIPERFRTVFNEIIRHCRSTERAA
jgi:DNA-binding MarR family transcriptional regulator